MPGGASPTHPHSELTRPRPPISPNRVFSLRAAQAILCFCGRPIARCWGLRSALRARSWTRLQHGFGAEQRGERSDGRGAGGSIWSRSSHPRTGRPHSSDRRQPDEIRWSLTHKRLADGDLIRIGSVELKFRTWSVRNASETDRIQVGRRQAPQRHRRKNEQAS